jgi:ribonuclease-3
MIPNKKNDFAILQRTLGYQFSDSSLLVKALSHRSVGKNNNERLEFLGDSLLNLVISESLYQRFPQAKEGELSRLRAHLVKGETLAELAREFNLGECLILGGGELKSGGHRRSSILADCVEAIIGAIYFDSDFERCRERILAWFESRLIKVSENKVQKDPKTRLQEYMQERRRSLPEYCVVAEEGENHARSFKVACRLDDNQVFEAVASSKRNAEKESALLALKSFGLTTDE